MTEITDQDRHAARVWAKNWQGDQDDDTSAAARVILATVDAPAPTLAERLEYRADLLDNGDPDGDTPQALRDLAAHAAQMEHDLTEARAEVERLTAERDHSRSELAEVTNARDSLREDYDHARAEVERLTAQNTWPKTTPSGHTYNKPTKYGELRHQCVNAAQAASEGWDDAERPPEPTWEMVGIATAEVERLCDLTVARIHERDEARAEMDHLRRDIAEAYKTRDARDDEVDRLRAEVERLTAVNENLRRTDNYRQFREQFLTTQKAAESNAETTDPADVKPGEAWIVECRGERRTAVKDRDDDEPWNTFTAGGLLFPEENENITLVSRLVPAPRVITNPEELHRAKRYTVIRDAAGVVCERDGMSDAWTTFTSMADHRPHIILPATVLWEPEV